MYKLPNYLIAMTEGNTEKENIIIAGNTRISVILPGVIRVEQGKREVVFTDSATQKVWFRKHGITFFETKLEGNKIHIRTSIVEVCINCRNGKVLYSKIKGKKRGINKKNNLKGTARTLDQCAGAVQLGEGVLSLDGIAILDDSKSLLVMDDGRILPRKSKGKDYYIFAYGNDYVSAVQALYKLCGNVPLIPRYALGNWWSRYKAYTQDEYERLMLKFEEKRIPFSVATIDMDWHWVNLESLLKGKKIDLGKKNGLGFGWTGYSWNTELFPDYKRFLRFLKGHNLKITLNLHPASGVRCYENQYKDMAEAVGINPLSGDVIDFDITDTKFIEAYFKYLHNPYEEDGVDFWWIDWQQGKKSKVAGLDPLWALNHYHYLNAARKNKRPLILSRYSGLGSHRYPLGFSGDTWITWAALRFQPYFTANAANCGYTWWSHDIGGHLFGGKDEELYVRWIQFGVFSPICRLHSSNNAKGKEPWNYSEEICKVASDFLRLRKKLVPYLYTMNYRNYKEGRALCEPLYYSYKEEEAYKFRNEYMFGSQLLVCPVTTKMNKRLQRAITKLYLPEGRWTNIFNGEIFPGGKVVEVSSSLEEMPVFAKEGAIIPFSLDEGNGVKNPEKLLWKIYRGNNTFELYEDDGETKDYMDDKMSITRVTQKLERDTLRLQVEGVSQADYLPEKREHTFVFGDILHAEKITVMVNGDIADYTIEKTEKAFLIRIRKGNVDDNICIELKGIEVRE